MKKTKLVNPKLSSVDLCARGANQNAHIRLLKSQAGEEGNGEPASYLRKAYDYLRHLFEDGEVDDPTTIEKSVEITKSECHQYIDALKDSFTRTLEDEAMTAEEKADLMQKSLCEFHAFMLPAAGQWANYNVVEESMNADSVEKSAEMAEERWKCNNELEATVDSILKNSELNETQKEDMIAKAVDSFSEAYKKIYKEGDKPMNMDKLSPEEQATLKKLMAKANGEQEPDNKPQEPPKKDPELEKKEDCKKSGIKEEDLPEAVRKAIERSNQYIEQMERKEMEMVAKKYEPLGQKAEELANTLYDLKKSNQAAYDSCVALMDSQLEIVNKSGLFTEIGKSGVQKSGNDAVAKAENIATEIMKSDPTLTRDQAMAKAWETHPELVNEYEGR